MTIRHLPAMPEASQRLRDLRCDLSPMALEHWDRSITAADDGEENSISILDPIGFDPWTGDGVTAKRISAVLRGMKGDVNVTINSPGGNYFEGLAIYNLFRAYPGVVNMKIVGVAASAASVIAMAGDRIEIARAAFFMIHNASAIAAGDRRDFRELADMLEKFDATMADVYATRTGDKVTDVQAMLDAETWIGGSEAVNRGFADGLLAADQVKKGAIAQSRGQIAAQRLDVVLAKAGMTRTERRALINEIKTGTPGAADPDDTPSDVVSGTPSATESHALTGTPLADLHAALFGLTTASSNVLTGEHV